eukprot:gene13375-17935_t
MTPQNNIKNAKEENKNNSIEHDDMTEPLLPSDYSINDTEDSTDQPKRSNIFNSYIMSAVIGTSQGNDRLLKLFSVNLTKNERQYPKNIIVSSRYTLINFLPKSLLEQFRRLANVYFLVLGVIAAIGEYTNAFETAIQPAGILSPMALVVLISVIKDGIEDVKRHTADGKINARLARRVIGPEGTVVPTMWRDLAVGDIVLVRGDDELPADIVAIACGGVQGQVSFVETAAIDGETNLKMKIPCLLKQTIDNEIAATDILNTINLLNGNAQVSGLFDQACFSATITAEEPNGSIHRFNGFIDISYKNSTNVKSTTIALTEKNLLLRGSVLRATEWCIGMVVYTGADTKLSLNSKQTPSKLSSVDRIVNRTLLIAISTMILVCIISMILSIIWEETNSNAAYLCLQKDDLSSMFPNGGGCTSSSTNSYLTFFTFATLYNNFVCISMYVSLEMVYLCQSFFIGNDLKLYDPVLDVPAECHSSGMCADLGQVSYILSDKTGTLTKNLMVVKQYSIADKLYSDDYQSRTAQVDLVKANAVQISKIQEKEQKNPLLLPSVPKQANELPVLVWPLEDVPTFSADMYQHQKSLVTKKLDHTNSINSSQDLHEKFEFEDRLKIDFLRVLTYCNTAMLMPNALGQVNIQDLETLTRSLQAESPDEVALILAVAKYNGILLTKNYNNQIESNGLILSKSNSVSNGSQSIIANNNNNNDSEKVEVLAINHFDSDRKMMSVMVRIIPPQNSNQSSRIVLLCKGADSSMFANCDKTLNPFYSKCMNHVDKFAGLGLRTLVAAIRELNENEAKEWLASHAQASNSLGNRQEMLSACAKTIETNMLLLGAIGIEDELQDDVGSSIEILRSAGLNVWMITGDKAETAVAIGKKCRLISDLTHDIQKVVNLTGEALRQRILDLHSLVEVKKQSIP